MTNHSDVISRMRKTVITDSPIPLSVVSLMRTIADIPGYIDSDKSIDLDSELSSVCLNPDGARVVLLTCIFCLPHTKRSVAMIRSNVSAIISYFHNRMLESSGLIDAHHSPGECDLDWQDGLIELSGLTYNDLLDTTHAMLSIASAIEFIISGYTINADDIAYTFADNAKPVMVMLLACLLSMNAENQGVNYIRKIASELQRYIIDHTRITRSRDMMSHTVNTAFLARPGTVARMP